jgi:hypothetical protein
LMSCMDADCGIFNVAYGSEAPPAMFWYRPCTVKGSKSKFP